MTTQQVIGHISALVLAGAVTVFINSSSAERPLRRYDTALLPLLQTDNRYLFNGVDLDHEGVVAPMPFGMPRGQDLSGMDLRKAVFSPSGLIDLRLRGSHLAQAEFSCVPLNRVDLSGADLRETHFDFSKCECPASLQSKFTNLPRDQRIKEELECTGPASVVLQVDLVGANLSGALLQGKVKPESVKTSEDPCEKWLVIKGRLNGARFEQAKLQCVALINLNSTAPNVVFQAPPEYAGIRFVQSNLNHVYLQSGNFMFSDFWQARVNDLRVNLKDAELRFSSLGGWQCPKNDYCSMRFDHPGEAISKQLSLSVTGSRIRSNLPLPAQPKADQPNSWPALLCDEGTEWISLPEDSISSKPQKVTCNPTIRLLNQASNTTTP